MNLPNKLTVSRFILTAAFLIVFFTAWRYHETVALVLFCVASLTDYFDGMIARRDKLITNFGILMDPLANKILVCSAFIAFVDRGWIPAWMAVIVVAREWAITGLRLLALEKPRPRCGTFRQTQNDFANSRDHRRAREEQLHGMGRSRQTIFGWKLFGSAWVNWFTTLSLWLAVALTFVSGTIYLWRNREIYLQDM